MPRASVAPKNSALQCAHVTSAKVRFKLNDINPEDAKAASVVKCSKVVNLLPLESWIRDAVCKYYARNINCIVSVPDNVFMVTERLLLEVGAYMGSKSSIANQCDRRRPSLRNDTMVSASLAYYIARMVRKTIEDAVVVKFSGKQLIEYADCNQQDETATKVHRKAGPKGESQTIAGSSRSRRNSDSSSQRVSSTR